MNKSEKKKKDEKTIIAIALTIIMLTVTIILFNGLIRTGATALADSYKLAYSTQKNATYQEKYETFKNNAEERYHVSNRVSIYIGNLKEEQKLEVLNVSDVEFVVEDKADNAGNIVSWLEVPGEGTFVVDLKAGEYIVDNEHAHVLVRVPYPELANVKIDYANVTKMLFKDDVFNGSYRQGEELARQQLGEAELLIRKEFTSNQNFYLTAQEAARNMIGTLVKQLNPGVDELSVDVEFY